MHTDTCIYCGSDSLTYLHDKEFTASRSGRNAQNI